MTMKMFKGMILIAKGGWDAEVIWISQGGFFAMHKPEEGIKAVGPIWHLPDGTAHGTFSVNEPPSYDGHPADLEIGEYEL